MYLALLCKHHVCTKLKSLLGTLPVRREWGEVRGVVSDTIGYTLRYNKDYSRWGSSKREMWWNEGKVFYLGE